MLGDPGSELRTRMQRVGVVGMFGGCCGDPCAQEVKGIVENEFRFTNQSDNETLMEAERLIRRYTESRETLKRLGVIRTGRSLQGDYAEWIVSRMLGLDLSKSAVEKGIDGRDSADRTYQIKSRQVADLASARTSFDISDPLSVPFDYLVGVFFGQAFEVLGVIRIPYEVVMELGSQTRSTFRLYWNSRTSQDSRIERVFWPEDTRKQE